MPTANPNSAKQPKADFSGLWIRLITPFCCDSHAVDHEALKRLLLDYLHSGIAGYVECGSIGQSAALSQEEQWAVLDTLLEHADGPPVVNGLSSHRLGEALDFVAKACSLPIVVLLVAAPH